MKEKEIVDGIKRFPRWHYQFDLKGHLTLSPNKRSSNRQVQRKKYFFDPLVELLGGTLSGKRILDLGCNAGFWSLQAVENGCEFALGIDGRQMHVEQAGFVFDVHQIPKTRYQFIKGNVFETDFKRFGAFDIVFLLGLMYHISKPIELMEKIAAINTDILVVDTSVSMAKGSFLEIVRESLDDPRNTVDYELVLRPTKEAVFDIVRQFGYDVVMLKPEFQDYTRAKGYRRGKRRAFLCAKKTALSGLAAKTEPAPRVHGRADAPEGAGWFRGIQSVRSLLPR